MDTVESPDESQPVVASSEQDRRCRLSEAAVLRVAKDGARAVLINAETGSMFMLNRTGLFVCKAIMDMPRNVDEIVSILGNVMRLPSSAGRDISALLEVLEDKGFVVWQ